MRFGLLIGLNSRGNASSGGWQETLEKARIAESLGIEFLSTGEAWGPSSIPWLTAVALNTSKVTIGTSILNVFSRTPAAIAQDFVVLDELSEGRMVLGLGTSGANVIEHFHGVPFKQPLRRLREYVEIFNILISGEPLNYDGEIFQMQRGFRLNYHRVRDHIPVYIAAITPTSIRQTGEIADGILPIHWPKALFAQLREDLRAGAAAAGQPDKSFTIAPYTKVTILDGSREDEAKRREAQQLLQFYINRMGVFYWQMLERNGFAEEVQHSRAAWAERDAEGSIAAISDRMLHACQVIGPIEAVREQLQERAALGADIQMLYMPPGDPAQVGRTLESLMR
jgi:alkanesulfonate monooxygenase SsuD/methylene tetrahydromethanopterin reductase-like flavin-dependent oxidoreductase (luciferase family)